MQIRKSHIALMLVVGTMLSLGCAQRHEPAPATQTPQRFRKTITRRAEYRYLLYLPRDYAIDSKRRWPLVIFLHGKGERGDDLERVKSHGPPKMVKQGREFPFVLASPQCPDKQRWNVDDLNALLDDLLARHRVDRDRVYVTGLSMGGWGTWQWISKYPQRFAAAVPICGGADRMLFDRTNLPPVWAFHGDQDKAVPVEESRHMVEKWRQDGGEAKLTIYPGVGHDSWKKAYDDPAMWQWLLSHKRENH